MSSWKNSIACVDDKTYAMTPPEAFNSWPPIPTAVPTGRKPYSSVDSSYTQYRPGR